MKAKPMLNGLMLVLATTGVLFKTMHWPGASMMLILAFGILFISLFTTLLKENKAQGMSSTENAAMITTFSFLILGTAFRMQHWPGAMVLVVLGTFSTLALVFYGVFNRNSLKLGAQGTFTLLLFLVILGGLLPNNAWVAVFNAN
jgi:glucan phosphoethanolaminetransferase (alkaline phosphatase superfamily)